MKKIFTLVVFLLSMHFAKAQYVTIPDTNFRNYLQANFPTAMVGNQMDTTDANIVGATYINCSGLNISDLTGIQYFDGLDTLECSGNQLISLPSLPNSLSILGCGSNQLISLPSLPNSLSILDCGSNQLTSLPVLPNSLATLVCYNNQLTSLPVLPNSLIHLWCYDNQLTSLPALPNSLTYLDCNNNQLTSLPSLSNSLTVLRCFNNQLISLPMLPNSLATLVCYNNQLTNLPLLPDSLAMLECNNNQITSLPLLPDSLAMLECNNNQLTTLPSLPNSITNLICNYNQLTSLPVLPNTLKYLTCSNNQLTSLPVLPNSLIFLYCNNNQITSLPSLPILLNSLYCDSNLLSYLPLLPDTLRYLSCRYNNNLYCLPIISQDSFQNFNVKLGTGITCLPKALIIASTTDSSDLLPICTPTQVCLIAYNIIGNTHLDTSSNCVNDSLNNGMALKSIKMQKWKSGVLDHQMFTNNYGQYSFDANVGDTISVNVDTLGMPFKVACPTAGVRAFFYLTLIDSVFDHQDFGIQCNGIDLGVKSIQGTFRKNQNRPVYIKAGDLSQDYNLNCSNGISGTVTTTLAGSVTYVSPQAGALTPTSVVGNVLTYNIADFGAINIDSAFNLIIHTDSAASLGSAVCVQTIVNTTTDINHSNDTLQFCGVVVNSFDPNEKEAYPIAVTTPDSWLTYTIHFQNTGTDTAYHIIVRDTLSNYLNPATFTYLAASVEPQIDITGNAVMFNFPHINLIDSFHNEPMSHGWLQYKIKTKANLPLNTNITNTAFIYFDDNAPVVTNTTNNKYSPLAINNVPKEVIFSIYPNPTEGEINIESNQAGMFILRDMIGKEVFATTIQQINSSQKIILPKITPGIYSYTFTSKNGAIKIGKLMIR